MPYEDSNRQPEGSTNFFSGAMEIQTNTDKDIRINLMDRIELNVELIPGGQDPLSPQWVVHQLSQRCAALSIKMLKIKRIVAFTKYGRNRIVGAERQMQDAGLNVVAVGFRRLAGGVVVIALSVVDWPVVDIAGRSTAQHPLGLLQFEFQFFETYLHGCIRRLLGINQFSLLWLLPQPSYGIMATEDL